jgi:hypothetical protein
MPVHFGLFVAFAVQFFLPFDLALPFCCLR